MDMQVMVSFDKTLY